MLWPTGKTANICVPGVSWEAEPAEAQEAWVLLLAL